MAESGWITIHGVKVIDESSWSFLHILDHMQGHPHKMQVPRHMHTHTYISLHRTPLLSTFTSALAISFQDLETLATTPCQICHLQRCESLLELSSGSPH